MNLSSDVDLPGYNINKPCKVTEVASEQFQMSLQVHT